MNNKERMKIKQSKLSHERLIEILEYNPKTGIFVNKDNRYGAKKGEEAGFLHCLGYVIISIDGIKHKAHRLAWFYMFKRWPEEEIDHRNRIRNDNRISNLREATHYINSLNIAHKAEKRSGVEGIVWIKEDQSWIVRYKGKYLGYAQTVEEGIEFQNEARLGVFNKRSHNSPNQSGVNGVVWHKSENKWRVIHDGKHLCHVDSIEEGTKIKRQAVNGTFIKDNSHKSENQSGISGVIWDKRMECWRVSYKRKYLEHVKTIEEGIKTLKRFHNGTFVKKDKPCAAKQSGISGITWNKQSMVWRVFHKQKYMGRRETLAEALLLKLESANGGYIKGLKELYTIPA